MARLRGCSLALALALALVLATQLICHARNRGDTSHSSRRRRRRRGLSNSFSSSYVYRESGLLCSSRSEWTLHLLGASLWVLLSFAINCIVLFGLSKLFLFIYSYSYVYL